MGTGDEIDGHWPCTEPHPLLTLDHSGDFFICLGIEIKTSPDLI